MTRPEMSYNAGFTPAFGNDPADAAVTRIAERVTALPPDDAIWREAAALNAAQHPLAAALARGEIDWSTYQERLRIVSGPLLALAGDRASEVLLAAALLLQREAAASPLDSPN